VAAELYPPEPAAAEDACAHAWLQLCRTQPERTESLPGWLRVVALPEGFRLLRKGARELPAEDVCRQQSEDDGRLARHDSECLVGRRLAASAS
jgi:hypothetical protein